MTSQLNYIIAQQRHLGLVRRAEQAEYGAKHVRQGQRNHHLARSAGSSKRVGSGLQVSLQLRHPPAPPHSCAARPDLGQAACSPYQQPGEVRV
jgi:hypothetical protein